jgi:predicted DNA-binding transcriptional regulator YafY
MARERRKPSYEAATRLAAIMLQLSAQPWGMSFGAIQRRFSISERTMMRYVAACRKKLLDPGGRPLVEVVPRGSQRYLRLARVDGAPHSTAYQAASLYFVLTLLKFLDQTVIREGVEDIWERVRRDLPGSQQLTLADFDRKFYSVDYAPKLYREHEQVIDLLLRALIHQWRLQIDYAGLGGEGKTHRFDPYTLIVHKGGLYLIGLSDVYKKIVYLAVERIRTAVPLLDANQATEKFVYPRGYRPEKHLDGAFGIIDGPETKVELLLLGDTEALLRSRAIHPTQRFHRRDDGKTVLTLTVRGTAELRNWILSHGPWVEVLKPGELRQEVADLLASAAGLYLNQNA